MAGYHLRKINKGVLGEFSKIQEEFEELEDSHEQKIHIMELLELSDLVGAIHLYYQKHEEPKWMIFHNALLKNYYQINVFYQDLVSKFNNINHNSPTFEEVSAFVLCIHHYVKHFNLYYSDLYQMHTITKRAFLSGNRT